MEGPGGPPGRFAKKEDEIRSFGNKVIEDWGGSGEDALGPVIVEISFGIKEISESPLDHNDFPRSVHVKNNFAGVKVSS
jgi:hypothetical protein